MTLDRARGCLLGLALGDALGAPYEGGLLERMLWSAVRRTRSGAMRWTDDTQMSLDLAESLIAIGSVEPDDIAARFARSYRWSRGYGPGAAKILKRIARGTDWRESNRSVHPDGSFGNGGAMRAPVVGLFFAGDQAELLTAARLSAQVTHAHPLGIEGSILLAAATACALTSEQSPDLLREAESHCQSDGFLARVRLARTWTNRGDAPGPDEVRRRLGAGIAAVESCVSAIYLATRFLDAPFEELHRFAVEMGGDVDTIGSMAGALWGAKNGATALPPAQLSYLEQRDRIERVAESLHKAGTG